MSKSCSGRPLRWSFLVIVALAGLAVAEPWHGLGLYGPEDLRLGPDEPFPYVQLDAPKGGELVLHSGNFTTLNPFTLKGLPARLISLIFESATVKSNADDEPFSTYGHLVESIELAADRLSLVYRLRQAARFADGVPVRADDFVFSFEIMKHPEFNPRYKQYFADIESIEKIDELTVRYRFRQQNQELPLIVGEMPILPRHVYGAAGKDFGKDFDSVAVGSGPYLIDRYEFGKYIVVRRNPDWWARDLPRSRGMYNFDRITAKVYLDEVATKEAFKGGAFDLFYVTIAKDWALDFHGPYVQQNYIVRAELPHRRPVGMQGFAFNLRNPRFASLKTRFAIAMVLDFDWMNANLFYDQYTRVECFFGNSPDMTNTAPPSGRLLTYLEELRRRHGPAAVPKMALEKPLRAPGQGQDAATNLAQAELLLESVGWELQNDGIRARDGQRLAFELLLHQQTWQRIAEPYQRRLRQLGVELKVTILQPAEYEQRVRTFDYDMIVMVYGHSDSIGNEQLDYFGSAAADTEGSWNFTGLKNPAVDEVLASLVAAPTRSELAFYGQALDRLLMSNTIVVPHWNILVDRTLYWNKFGRPPLHCSKLYPETAAINHWWHDPEQARALAAARAAKLPLPAPR